MNPLAKKLIRKIHNTHAEKTALVLRFNQLLIFHTLLLLAISLFTSSWLGQLSLIDIPLIW